MTTHLFKIGDKVILATNRHGDHSSNPVWRGNYGEISGTVDKLHKGSGLKLSVLWNNGELNSYNHEDLEFLDGFKRKRESGFEIKFKNKTGEVVCSIKDYYIVNFKKDMKGFSCDGKYEKGSCLFVKKSEAEKVEEKGKGS